MCRVHLHDTSTLEIHYVYMLQLVYVRLKHVSSPKYHRNTKKHLFLFLVYKHANELYLVRFELLAQN
jgi:hypothetical protein